MKAFHLLMGLILFNISIGLFNAFGIWDIGYTGNISDIITRLSISLVTGLLVGLGIATAAGILFPHAEKNVTYASFSLIFITLWTNTTLIFSSFGYEIDQATNSVNGTLLVSCFFAIGVILLIVGIYQMSTGGWASYE